MVDIDKKVHEFMELLDISEDEAKQLIKDDDAIDHGAKLFELTAEQKKAEKNARKTGTRTVYNFTKRERKANPTKAQVIAEIADFVEKSAGFASENVAITNKERQISFKIGDNDYELTLVQKRKPKK